ncbi:MAG TPA: hypothetical protein VFY01_11610, partial [Rheinheimera sp.]|nr:hypothetical protein [Rheinheimera sp.]
MELNIGDKIRVKSDKFIEYGIIVWIWEDPDCGFKDAFIASFGDSFPVGTPQKKPEVWRYAISSLELANEI